MAEISENMRRDNWAFFVLARSTNPEVMVPNTRKLISNLIASMVIAKELQYYRILLRCLQIANDAWIKFSKESDWGAAVQDCEGVIDQITPLIYDSRWATSEPDSFKSPITSEGA